MPQSLAQASKHIQGFSILVLGRALGPLDAEVNFSNTWYLGTYIPLLKEMNMNFKTEAEANSLIVNFDAPTQIKFLKTILYHVNSTEMRRDVINGLYNEVFGAPATPAQFNHWNQVLVTQQKDTYVSMKIIYFQWYNEHEDERIKSIHNAYQYGMGRNATKDEVNYWSPLRYSYKEMQAAQVPWLYSANGKKDLSETIDRVFMVESGKKPTDNIRSKFLSHISQFRVPYIDMFTYYNFFFHPIG